MDTQTTYRGYVIRRASGWPGLMRFHHVEAALTERSDRRFGWGSSEQDCRDQIDHQINNAQALSDRDGEKRL